MCMEVIIFQSERSPKTVMISQTPTLGGTSKTHQMGVEIWQKLSQLFG